MCIVVITLANGSTCKKGHMFTVVAIMLMVNASYYNLLKVFNDIRLKRLMRVTSTNITRYSLFHSVMVAIRKKGVHSYERRF